MFIVNTMKLLILLFIACVQCDIISELNRNKQFWKAEETIKNIDYREDVVAEIQPQLNVLEVNTKNATLPEKFDWRIWAKQCTHEVINGGSCANSWATTPAMVLNYRACQQGKPNRYSAARVLACCQYCGAGCYGGYPWRAFNFVKNEGVPSDRCHALPSFNTPIRGLTPNCRQKSCDNEDLKYTPNKVNTVYKVNDIRYEIYQRGPVVSHMTLFKDFCYYKSGIYRHILGPKVGWLNVILLGWGEENGVKFWIGENTWGKEWGENGYFRIVRGVNNANVEQFVTAALI